MKTRSGWYSEQIRNLSFKEVMNNPIYLKESHRTILRALTLAPDGLTMREISDRIGMEVHLVSARLYELREPLPGEDGLVVEAGERINPVSNRRNTIYKLNQNFFQKQLTLIS